jgi:hypothetical protein
MYYLLEEKPVGDTTDLLGLGPEPDIPGVDFMRGRRFDPAIVIPRPLRYELSPEFPGELPWFFKSGGPLMHDSIVEVLRDVGVDNIDVYDALLVDTADGTEWTEYKAVNIIGVVAAVDVARSRFDPAHADRLMTSRIEGLTLDEKKAGDLLIFRLAEKLSAIVVHEKIKQAIEATDIGPLGFIEPKDWYGGI